MNKFDSTYLQMNQDILETGYETVDRTGVGIINKFGLYSEYDISEKFPLLTSKKMYWKGIVHELLWIISGSTNISYLQQYGVNIWNEWADENGNLGPVYGKQLRQWEASDGQTVDQLSYLIHQLKYLPSSRRKVITLWNPGEIEYMKLPPCHGVSIQFEANPVTKKLDCFMHQRSGDMFLGVPFNIASYSLLTYMIAQVTGYKPGTFKYFIGDAHIYKNHIEAVKQQLDIVSLEGMIDPPEVKLNPEIKHIDDFRFDDIHLIGYNSHPSIKAEVAV